MNVSSVSNVSSNFNSNGLNKVNNGPSFGALRADAADMFIKKATETGRSWGQKTQNSVLQEIVRLAQRAKQSLVLDIGAKVDDSKATLELIDVTGHCKNTTLPFTFSNFERYKGEPAALVSARNADGIPEVFDKDTPYLCNITYGHASVGDFVDSIINAFNKRELEVVDQIETDKITETLSEKLSALIKEEF